MKKYLLLALIASFNVSAQTDYQCLNNCTGKGYQYAYCSSICSYNTQPQVQQPQVYQPAQIPQVDYQCVSDCTSKGYQYQFCTSRCSY